MEPSSFPPVYLAEGYATLRDLRDRKVLQDTDRDSLREYNGGAMVPCLDANHFEDLYLHHAKLSASRRLAPITRPGGGVCVASTSPLAVAECDGQLVNERLSVLRSMDVAVHHLGIRSCYLYGHFPCKACWLAGMNVRDQFQALVDAKAELKERYEEPNKHFVVALMFHRAILNKDDTWGPRKTYHVKRELVVEYLKTPPPPYVAVPMAADEWSTDVQSLTDH